MWQDWHDWLPLVEQELFILPEYLSSLPIVSGVRLAQPLIFYVVFCRSLLVLCPFTFGHCIVYPFSIYSLWLPLWYFHTFGHCVVCPSTIYSLWLPLWYLHTFGHRVVCPSTIYSFWLPLWYLHTFGHCVVYLSTIYSFGLPLLYLRFTASDYPFGILDLRHRITPLVS